MPGGLIKLFYRVLIPLISGQLLGPALRATGRHPSPVLIPLISGQLLGQPGCAQSVAARVLIPLISGQLLGLDRQVMSKGEDVLIPLISGQLLGQRFSAPCPKGIAS